MKKDLSEQDVFAINWNDEIAFSSLADDQLASSSQKSRKKLDPQVVNGSGKIVPWGDDNLWYENLLETAQKSTIIPSTLEKFAETVYGGGVVAGKLKWDDKGNEIFVPDLTSDEGKKVRAFFRQTNIDAYLYSAALNYAWGRQFHPFMALNKKDKGKRGIASIRNVNNQKLRWIAPGTDGKVVKALLHGDWGNVSGSNKPVPVNVVEECFDTASFIREYDKDSFIYKPQIPQVLGNEYYPTPNWYSAKLSKWLDFSLQIPEFKKFLMENQMSVKYIIYIDTAYWKERFSNWNTMKDSEKKNKRTEVMNEFLKAMKGTEKGGGAVITDMYMAQNGSSRKLWEIEELGKESKNDKLYLEDSQEASSHIIWSLGADPSVIGAGPGKQMGAGSGSDKRVAANLQVSMIRHLQDLLLKPLELWRDTNDDISDDFVFRTRNTIQLTLDQGKSQQQTS